MQQKWFPVTKENIKYKVKLLGFFPSIIDRARVDSKIIDGCAWTIISTDQAKYTFYEAMGPTADLPTPVPIIERLHVNGGGETACIDITGKNFTSKLKVCQHFEICQFLTFIVLYLFLSRFGLVIARLKQFADLKKI